MPKEVFCLSKDFEKSDTGRAFMGKGREFRHVDEHRELGAHNQILKVATQERRWRG